MRDRLGIYIHIPFCVSKCSYCDFYSIAGGKQRMPDYQSALLSHISESAEAIESYEIDSIYIGGGMMVNALGAKYGIVVNQVNTSRLTAVRRIV